MPCAFRSMLPRNSAHPKKTAVETQQRHILLSCMGMRNSSISKSRRRPPVHIKGSNFDEFYYHVLMVMILKQDLPGGVGSVASLLSPTNEQGSVEFWTPKGWICELRCLESMFGFELCFFVVCSTHRREISKATLDSPQPRRGSWKQCQPRVSESRL